MSVILKELDGVLTAMNSLYANFDNEVAAYNLLTRDDNYIVEIPLVGILKEDLVIDIKENVLNVSAKTKSKSVFSRDYRKSFLVNKDADTDNVLAKLENGLLTITIPKLKSAKKIINVNVV